MGDIEGETSRNWEGLDADLLAEVFGRLDVKDRLLSIPFVCKSWKKASLLPLCWRILDFSKSYCALVRGLLCTYRLESFSFSGLLKLLLPRAQGSTTHLGLPPSVPFEDSMPFTADEWNGLFYDWDDDDNVTWVTEEGLLVPSNEIQGSNSYNIMPFTAKDLEVLSGNWCGYSVWITEEDLEVLSNECPRLKSVALCRTERNHDKICEVIGKWKDLESLAMQGNQLLVEKLLRQIGNNCPNFKTLQLIDTNMSAGTAHAVVKYTPNIKQLYLWYVHMDKVDLLHILRGCEHLALLSIKSCIRFDSSDEELLSYFSSIRYFTYENCKFYNENGYLYPHGVLYVYDWNSNSYYTSWY